MKRFGILVFCVLVFSFFIGSASAEVGVTDTEIKIGYHGPLTGPAAIVGAAEVHGMKVAIADINARGGVHGRKIVLIAEDDAMMPTRAREMVKKLIYKDKIFCFLGPLGTAGITASWPEIEKNKVPVLFFMGAGDRLQRPARRYIFGYSAPYRLSTAIQVDYAYKKLGKKKLAFINMWGPAGEDNVKSSVARAKLYPEVKILFNEKLKNVKMDYSGLVAKMKTAGVDCVIPTCMANWSVPLIKEIQRQAWDVTIIVGHGSANPGLLNKLAGSAVEGAYLTMIFPSILSDDPFMNRYREMMEKYGGGKGPNDYGFMSYGITVMFEKALKECGKNLTREKLIDTIESWKNYDTGWLGVISYSPTDHEGQEGMVIGRMKGGEAQIITPRYYPDPKP